MNERSTKYFLIFIDWLVAVFAWALFFYFRKVYIEEAEFMVNKRFLQGIIIIPICWSLIHFFLGTYQDVKRLHLTGIINQTFKSVFIGSVVLFFIVILDDEIEKYSAYYSLAFALFSFHFLFILIPRSYIVYRIVSKIHKGKLGFNTLLVGGGDKASTIYDEIISLPQGNGNIFKGFLSINGYDQSIQSKLNYFGNVSALENVIKEQQIEEIILAIDKDEQEHLKAIMAVAYRHQVRVKVIPGVMDFLSGSVQISNIFGALLIELKITNMPFWQFVIKRFLDLILSAIAIVLLIPVYISLAIIVKRSSVGPIFFKQERIGKNGVPFKIIKFRTMYIDAEKSGPQLSSSEDPRITGVGRFMRKTRLDELPQFWNVIKGEMSLVGPRPERQFFIDKIAEREPQFLQLTAVKPGITSWGQVKYGYAESVDQMIQRMKFDLLYLKNMSLALDFKILLYTIIIVFKGTGK
jgi:exopolysaccharide biosynthesis polyprenyl glycosylphosphotransferase